MATNWITIAVTDLDDYLAAAQMTALRTAALRGGQADPFAKVMADVVSRIRLKIQSCDRNSVSLTAATIPAECKWIACVLIIEAMQTRLPGLALTEEQKGMISDAKDELNLIASCKSAVTAPTDPLIPSEAQRGGGIRVVTKTTPQASRTKLDGI